MSDTTILRGSKRRVLAQASRTVAAAPHNSDPFHLVAGGWQGIVITIIVDSVGSSGQIDTVEVQAEESGNFDTIATFNAANSSGLPITATGRYRFILSPVEAMQGATNYAGVIATAPPAMGRVRVTNSVATMILGAKVESL